MKNKEEPPEQTGAYLSYVTVCEGGSDKVIRGIARFYFIVSCFTFLSITCRFSSSRKISSGVIPISTIRTIT